MLVADWGGGWDGLDAAEVLARHGLDVTLACAAPCPGHTLHQYQRNLYLSRLDEEGIEILHHTEVTGRNLRHLFSRPRRAGSRASRRSSTRRAASRRTSSGPSWRASPGRVRAGDVLGPRSAEEATLEGVTALQAARAATSVT